MLSKKFNYNDVAPQGKILNNEQRENVTLTMSLRLARISEVLLKSAENNVQISETEKEQTSLYFFNELAKKYTETNGSNNSPKINLEEKSVLNIVFAEYACALFSAGYTAQDGVEIYRNIEEKDYAAEKNKSIPIALMKKLNIR
ncbi:MAG: hypothetical protein AB7U85_09365 [Alphaproteobacteria bacterium]